MGQEHDPELDDYLRGNSEVSRAYQRLKSLPLPADEIDRRLLDMARQPQANSLRHTTAPTVSTHRPPPRWFAPFALAASVVLSVALVLAVVLQPAKQRRADETPHWVHASARKTDRLRLRTEPSAATPRRFDSEAQPHDPQSWLVRIRELRREGRNLEADAENRRFRAAFPNYVTPDEDETAH